MASSQFITLYKVHEFLLERPPSNRSFNDRLVVQKTGYLSSLLGIYLGEIQFNFNWYRRGPYSPAYTTVLYEMDNINHNDLEGISNEYMLSERAQQTLLPIKNLIKKKPASLEEYSWLELLASVCFLYREENYFDKELCYLELVKRKPQYNQEEFLHAWVSLYELNFFRSIS